ncbi:ROK family protein [Verrucomicrobiota bacterium]
MGDNGGAPFWVGFDLGGTKMQASVFNDKFKTVSRKRKKTRAKDDGYSGTDRIAATITQALEDAGIPGGRPAGIGIGCPGPLDLDAGVVLELPNLGWGRTDLKKELEDYFGCPAYVINDVDAGVYGEYRFGAAKNARCAVGVFPGTGIGGGCVYQGSILRGKTTSCLEIGHCQVLPQGPLCGCGKRGCLEAVASRVAISAAAASAAFRGSAPALLKEAGTDLSNIRSSVLARSIQAGDAAVESIVRDAASWLGVGIGTVINLLAPDVVVLGGGLVEAMPKLFKEEVSRSAREQVMPALRDGFRLALAELGDDAAVMGAAAWARQSATAGG